MKGIIFNVLEDMIVQQCGMAVWNDLLEKHAPADRVYVSAKSYEDIELLNIVQDVAARLELPLQDVVKAFGNFLFQGLADRHARRNGNPLKCLHVVRTHDRRTRRRRAHAAAVVGGEARVRLSIKVARRDRQAELGLRSVMSSIRRPTVCMF